MFRSIRKAIVLSSLSVLLLSLGCAATNTTRTGPLSASSLHQSDSPRAIDYRHKIEAAIAPAIAPATYSLVTPRYVYAQGDEIAFGLKRSGSSDAIAIDGDCTTPLALWLRSETGETYFINSGARLSCSQNASTRTVAMVDSAMVWRDHFDGSRVYRLPRALPSGRYTAHALTAVGELVTTLEVE